MLYILIEHLHVLILEQGNIGDSRDKNPISTPKEL